MLKRKITAYLLLLTMIFSVFATSVAYADDMSEYEEYVEEETTTIDTGAYQEAFDLISTLGIVEGLSANGTMTRADLVGYMLQVIGMDVSLDNLNVTQIFEDVPPTHPNAAQIYACYDLGIINGVGGGMFDPDAEATYIQAVKMMVSALGYGISSRDASDMESYMLTAVSLKLNRNIDESYNAPLTGGCFAQLIYNALEIKNMKLTSAGIIKEYSDRQGDTILKYHDLIKIKDVVVENPVTAIYGRSTVRDGQVRIGDTACYVGETSADVYLGYYVLAYASYVEDVDLYPTLVYCEPMAGYNETVTLTEKEWQNAVMNGDYSITINYLDGRSSKKETLSPDADVIYNGVFDGTFDITDYTPVNADITLLDYDADGEYDIAIVKEYQTMFVESISTSTFNVGGQLDGASGTVSLNPESQDYTFKIIDDGEVVGFEAIEQKSILSVATSIDGSYKEVYVSKDTVDGVIEEISEDGSDVAVAVGYDVYDVVNYIVATNTPFSAGDDMLFYLDFRGNIAHYVPNSKSGTAYGYVISMTQDKGILGQAKMKVLDSDGTIGLYNCKEEVLLDYTTRVDGATLVNNFREYKNGISYKGAILNQVIQYKTNTSGEITEIVTYLNDRQDPEQGLSRPEILYADKYGVGQGWASKVTAKPASATTYPYLRNINYSGDGPAFFFVGEGGESMEDVMLVNPSATIFYVPDDTSMTEEFRFQVMRPDALKRISYTYPMEILNLDKNGKVHMALIRYAAGSTEMDGWAECHIIDEVDRVLLEDGAESYKIKGMSSTQYVEYLVDDAIFQTAGTMLPTDLERGDIVQFSFNSEGEVNYIENFISAENLGVKTTEGSYCADNGSLTYGKVERVDGAALKIATSFSGNEHIRFYGTRGLSCAVYDMSVGEDGLFYQGSIADVEVGDWVLVRAGQAWVTQWYIIKGVDR